MEAETGRSKLTVMVTFWPAASARVIGPIVLLMIRGPAAMTIGLYQMFSGSPTTTPLTYEL